jgi:2'-deoxynucleoside 5'-phosphate N-hydrolase
MPEPSVLRTVKSTLRAYVSGALTGLARDQAHVLYELAADELRGAGFLPYVPHLATDPTVHPDTSPRAVYETDRRKVAESDLMLVFLSYPSLGVGAELEIAAQTLVPILPVVKRGSAVSRMALGGPARQYDLVLFGEVAELAAQLRLVLPAIHAELMVEPRRDLVPVGLNLADARRRAGMSRVELARRVNVDASWVRLLEDTEGPSANPSLTFLRGAAQALGVSLGELLGTGASEGSLLRSLRSYSTSRDLTYREYASLEGLAARGLRRDRALSDAEWDQLRAQTSRSPRELRQRRQLPD